MKWTKLFVMALTVSSLFAGAFAEESSSCSQEIDALEKSLPQGSAQIRLTIAEARASAATVETLKQKNPKDARIASKEESCKLYVQIIKSQIAAQNSRNSLAANRKKQLAVRDSIRKIQEKIGEVRSGRASNLEEDLMAERAKLAQTNSAMDSAMGAAAAREALQAEQAKAREDSLNKLLLEERAKAEARQNEAKNKLNELQSKLIQVTEDARGIILSMSDILFDVDKASLKSDLKTSLARVAGILSVYQELNVSVEGHTDNTGSEEHNLKLSEQRAQNVLQFLVEQGIDAKRLSSKGYGMSKPVADNSTKEGRQKNRRVDLVIKDKVL
ncbi:MAG: OmpA family protein [Fibrobacter sp.]|jgi:outer membrane protein OmpA-like peptidoglycan-associated protein|nr:OmpA family protein [Fibrobacter sp.]MDY6369033.1 OmpA family protein [Fibrobacter sp.]MDY6390532.1 OmpA family protein [Fibrobacter sp.]